jgi:hypothetical protein
MSREEQKRSRGSRPPRIRVPNRERALFTADSQKFVGVIQRLSLTGGSAVLSKGPIASGTLAEMAFNTVFGKVHAQIEFLHAGADGVPLAQAFRFLGMDDTSSRRFSTAARQMQDAGFSDTEEKESSIGSVATEQLGKLRDSILRLAGAMKSSRGNRSRI